LEVRDAREELQEVLLVYEPPLQDAGDELLTADGGAEDDDAVFRRREVAFPHGDRGARLPLEESINARRFGAAVAGPHGELAELRLDSCIFLDALSDVCGDLRGPVARGDGVNIVQEREHAFLLA
jgi:hypothetical protein